MRFRADPVPVVSQQFTSLHGRAGVAGGELTLAEGGNSPPLGPRRPASDLALFLHTGGVAEG